MACPPPRVFDCGRNQRLRALSLAAFPCYPFANQTATHQVAVSRRIHLHPGVLTINVAGHLYATGMTPTIPKLTSVRLNKGNGSFLIRYDLDGPIPGVDTFLVGVNATSRDGKTFRQFGVKFLDGEPLTVFVFDHNATKQQKFDYVQALDDERIIITPYESTPYDELGNDPILRAYVNYAGDDVATDIPVLTN